MYQVRFLTFLIIFLSAFIVSCSGDIKFDSNIKKIKQDDSSLADAVAKDESLSDDVVGEDGGTLPPDNLGSDLNLVARDLELITESKEEIFSQISQPSTEFTKKQGYQGGAYTDTFYQDELGLLDVLVVIDNSGSMKEEQKKLAEKLQPLLSKVGKSNWKIGVVTTSRAEGCMRAIINKGDKNYEKAFKKAVNAGINGSGSEQGVLQAKNALDCAESPWLRDQSALAILFVSDEDNCQRKSFNLPILGCEKPIDSTEKDEFLAHLNNIRVVGESARVYGIFSDPDNSCVGQLGQSGKNTASADGVQYKFLVDNTSGTHGSICDKDYTDTLSKISEDAKTILTNSYLLTYEPDLTTIIVTVRLSDGSTTSLKQGVDYQVDGKKITFKKAPAKGSQITVEYEYRDINRFKELAIKHKPVTDSVKVYFNGVEQGKELYRVSEISGEYKVLFTDYPPDNARVKVSYKKYQKLNDEFKLEKKPESKSIEVRVSDMVQSPENDYKVIEDKIVFFNIPSASSKIIVSYKVPKLSYEFPEGSLDSEVSVVDKLTKEKVEYTTKGLRPSGYYILFDEEEWRDGRVIEISYFRE